MESRFLAFMHNGDPGTATFDGLATRSFEQGFDSSPFNIAGNRLVENSGQGFSMMAVHSQYDTTFCHHVKLEMIKTMKIAIVSHMRMTKNWKAIVNNRDIL